ncbi:uncharacterized protein LOC127845869 [Dreissena polymorpha]|nr:uncharacterized protein LOC127845869 [Dreissena polymorpha]
MELPKAVAIKEVSMNQRCGEILSMILEDAYQIKLTLDDFGEGPNVCELTIEAWYTWPRMMVYVEDLNLNCSDGYIDMYDGAFDGTELRGVSGQVCGDNTTGDVHLSSGLLRVRYTRLAKAVTLNIMSMVVTAYSTRDDNECQSTSFQCDNGRCIEGSIRCNVHNSCGDHSDCRTDASSLIRTVTLVGCLVGIVTLATVAVISCRMVRRNKLRKPYKETKSNKSEQKVYTTEMSGHSGQNLKDQLVGSPPDVKKALLFETTPSTEQVKDAIVVSKSLTAAKKPAYPVSWLDTRKGSFK